MQNILAAYKQHITSSQWWNQEKFKWEAVKCFQDNWDVNASDFAEMLNRSLDKTFNLLASNNNFPKGMITEFANAAPEEVRAMFIALFDEKNDVVARILQFKDSSKLMLEKYGNGANQHFQSENAISTYLWLRFPDKYYIYKYGEVKSVKISKYLLETQVGNQKKEIETSRGFGFVCYTNSDGAKKAKEELNEKFLPGFDNWKRPLIIDMFMPKSERKQFLAKLQSPQNPKFSFPMNPPYPAMNPYMTYPGMTYQQPPRKHHGHYNRGQPRYRQSQQQNPKPQQNINTPTPTLNKEGEPNLQQLNSITSKDEQKNYLGEFLFKKIESHPLTKERNCSQETVSRITGMILGIDEIKEIYDITVNPDTLTARIQEALGLLENNQ